MAVVKCPRCEINFMRDDEECCSVCMRELRREKGKGRPEEDVEMCVECGLAPAITKDGLCALCAAEMMVFAPESGIATLSESESTSDNELDIISLELVEDEDEDDLLDIDLDGLENELDFADEDDEIDGMEDEDEMEFEDDFEDEFAEPSIVAVHMAR